MLTFDDLKFEPHPLMAHVPTAEGLIALAKFENGYSLSVVALSVAGREFSWGADAGLWECLALAPDGQQLGPPTGDMAPRDVTAWMAHLQTMPETPWPRAWVRVEDV